MLKDIDIRKALNEKLIKQNEGHAYRIMHELVICDGEARVDIAVANGKLQGYEIKSDSDTLERLARQMDAYNKTFDTITIIIGKKYEDKIKDLVPQWWGIKVAYLNNKGSITIKDIRAAKINKTINPSSVIQLLWKDEIVTLLKSKSVKGLSSKNRRKLRDIAVNTIPLSELKSYVRETLKTRSGWRTDELQ